MFSDFPGGIKTCNGMQNLNYSFVKLRRTCAETSPSLDAGVLVPATYTEHDRAEQKVSFSLGRILVIHDRPRCLPSQPLFVIVEQNTKTVPVYIPCRGQTLP